MRSRLWVALAVGVVATGSCTSGGSLPSNESPSRPSPTQASAQQVVRLSIYPLVGGPESMPTGTVALGEQEEPLCTQDFEWTLADGSRVRGIADPDRPDAIPGCRPSATAIRVPAGTPIRVTADGAAHLNATRTMAPLYPGLETVVVEAHWDDGDATFLAFLDVVVTGSSPTRVELSCALAERVAFEARGGPRIQPGGAAYVRGNLARIGTDDVVEQMTIAPDRTTEWDGTWQVVRDDSVIAAVKFPALIGIACRGSGVAGA